MRSHVRWMSATALVWATWPAMANAHLVNSGFGPFYDGIAHLFVTPEDLLAVLALAMLAGLGAKPTGRAMLFVLPAAWFMGALAGRMTTMSFGPTAASPVVLFVLGALVAANFRLSQAIVVGAALTCGIFNGCCNGATLAGSGSSALFAVGTSCAVFVIAALATGQVATLEKEWARIMVRVAGSWIGAIGLLMFGWAVRQGTIAI